MKDKDQLRNALDSMLEIVKGLPREKQIQFWNLMSAMRGPDGVHLSGTSGNLFPGKGMTMAVRGLVLGVGDADIGPYGINYVGFPGAVSTQRLASVVILAEHIADWMDAVRETRRRRPLGKGEEHFMYHVILAYDVLNEIEYGTEWRPPEPWKIT